MKKIYGNTKPSKGALINWAHPLSRGLVGYWPMNEGMGDKIYDFSGNKNTGTLMGMAHPSTAVSGWNPGKFGSALNFDSTNDYIVIGTNSIISASEGSVSLWVKFNAISKNEVLFISGAATADGINTVDSYRIRLDGATNKIYAGWITATEPDMSYSDSAMVINVWYHVVSVWGLSANLVNLYIDGKLQVEDDSFTGNNKNNWVNEIRIGRSMASATNVYPLDGSIDGVRIDNQALSAAMALQLYKESFCIFNR